MKQDTTYHIKLRGDLAAEVQRIAKLDRRSIHNLLVIFIEDAVKTRKQGEVRK